MSSDRNEISPPTINFVRFFFDASLFKSITLYISIIQIFKLPFFLKNFIIFIHYESKTSDENFLGNFTFHHPEIFETSLRRGEEIRGPSRDFRFPRGGGKWGNKLIR